MTSYARTALFYLLSATVIGIGPVQAMAPTVQPTQTGIAQIADGSRHADPELEALLPTSLGGVVLTVESQSGAELATKSSAFDAFLGGLGKTRADFTVALAARYPDLVAVVAGTTLGMMISNVPAVFLGDAIARKLSMKLVHGIAALVFGVLGVLTLFNVGSLF